jgi:hypothetical protein
MTQTDNSSPSHRTSVSVYTQVTFIKPNQASRELTKTKAHKKNGTYRAPNALNATTTKILGLSSSYPAIREPVCTLKTTVATG